jgi:hypothetical protein
MGKEALGAAELAVEVPIELGDAPPVEEATEVVTTEEEDKPQVPKED